MSLDGWSLDYRLTTNIVKQIKPSCQTKQSVAKKKPHKQQSPTYLCISRYHIKVSSNNPFLNHADFTLSTLSPPSWANATDPSSPFSALSPSIWANAIGPWSPFSALSPPSWANTTGSSSPFLALNPPSWTDAIGRTSISNLKAPKYWLVLLFWHLSRDTYQPMKVPLPSLQPFISLWPDSCHSIYLMTSVCRISLRCTIFARSCLKNNKDLQAKNHRIHNQIWMSFISFTFMTLFILLIVPSLFSLLLPNIYTRKF